MGFEPAVYQPAREGRRMTPMIYRVGTCVCCANFVPAVAGGFAVFDVNSLKCGHEIAANTMISGPERSAQMTLGPVFSYTDALPKRAYR